MARAIAATRLSASNVCSSAFEMLTNCVRITAGGREDAPAVRQNDRRHSIRRLHEVTQQKCRLRALS